MVGLASSKRRAGGVISTLASLLVCASLASAGAVTTNNLTKNEVVEHEIARNIGNPIRDVDRHEQTKQIDKTRQHLVVKRRVQSSQTSKLTPEFSAPIGNVTAVLGRDVRLVCTVENLGQHQVAWLKEETKTILSIDTNIIITNYRIFLIPDEEGRKWVLHIKDVQESDRGYYQCQVNTQPMRSTSGYLEVVVPPAIVENETTQLVEATEGANVTLQCKASGHPRPMVSWRREDGEPIKLEGRSSESSDESNDESNDERATSSSRSARRNQVLERESSASTITKTGSNLRAITHLNDVKSDRLQFTRIDRSMAGLYVCAASNGIPSQVSRQIPLYVKFPPKVSIGEKSLAVAMGEQLEIDCFIEAFPKPTSYWSERQMPSFRSASANMQRRGPASMPLVSAKWASQQRAGALAVEAMRLKSMRDTAATAAGGLVERSNIEGAENDISDSSLEVDGAPSDSSDQDQDRDEPDDDGQEDPKGSLLSIAGVKSDRDTAKSSWVNQTQRATSAGLVTVKQTAINSYTYKLRISIAKMRPTDFGEYICKSSNSMGSSSARVSVKMAERNQMPLAAAAAVGTTTGLNRPLSLTGDTIGENPTDYQRDSMGSNEPPLNAAAGHQQFIFASKPASNQQHLSPSEPRRSNFQMLAKPSRVYDENYLQAIRNRQSSSSSGYIGSSTAYGDRGNGAIGSSEFNLILIACIVAQSILLSIASLTISNTNIRTRTYTSIRAQ